uniref:glutamine--tRNA ligase n=1 Tax=Aegilops tauschii TaxID=37682 RepID=R7W940_AEGTA
MVDGEKDPAPLRLETLLALGLDQRTAENALVNSKVTANLAAVLAEAGITGCDKSVGNLLYAVATKYPNNALVHRPALISYIVSTKIKNPAQLDAALSFLTNTGPESLDIGKFEEACGVGVVVSIEEIQSTVAEVLKENMEAILEQREENWSLILHFLLPVGGLCGQVRKRHPWGDAKATKEEIEKKLAEILGPKTEADNVKPVKKKKEKPAKVEEKKVAVATAAPPSEEELNPYTIFPQPAENNKLCTSQVVILLAMFIDFGLAKERNGHCYLRFDDTNPEAEKKEYIDHIQEIVKWMGWEPYKVTYTSDYFQALYEHAVELIRKGLAYVDHQTAEQIKEYREKKMNSPWRDRPIEESLQLFEDMRRGLIAEGAATLRMKQDMQNDNKNMSDLIAYRIKFTPHPHAGDKWCIYPSYDYAHCMVDSLENITHSLCTLEFDIRRPSYYWLLVALGLYQPHVWEYSRLNISHTMMSKRKLNRLVTEKWVDGWDDPRLLTLAGLRRRGVSANAINSFIRGIGITRSDNSLIRVDRLEYHIREELNKTASRTMVVLHPLKVVITNLEDGKVIDLDGKKWPDAPADEASSYYKVPFSKIIYIEKTDFRVKDSKDYYGLAPGKSALLRYAFPIKCTEVIYGDNPDDIVEIRAEYDPSKTSKPKGVLHWVAQPAPGVDPLKVEIRLFEKLFLSENPAELEDWLGDLNPHSKEVVKDAYAVPSLATAVLGDKFQFERLGYFAVDTDSTPEKLVFNRTVTLRDSYGKAGPK